jgi:hypothetical protein
VDVVRAADLYAQGWTLRQIAGWTLRQIAAELGVSVTTASDQLHRAGVTMRRGAPPHPVSTQQIVGLRDQDQSWTEVAEKVGMTCSGARSRYQRSRPPKPARLGRWQQVLADALDQTLRLASGRLSLIISVEPPPGPTSPARRAAHGLAALGRARVLHVAGADADADAGDLSKPPPT